MAVAKKTTTTRKTTPKTTKVKTPETMESVEMVEEVKNPVVVETNSTEEEIEEIEAIEPVKAPEQKRKLKDGDYIMCRSVVGGGLNINCRSRNHYEFRDYGSRSEIEYRDLVELVRKHSDHIFIPRIIIEDEDFLDEFPELKRFYTDQYTVTDFKEILKLEPDQMAKEITKLPEDVLDTVRSLAATMVGNGEIDSVRKVRTLTGIFGMDFNLLSELFGAGK